MATINLTTQYRPVRIGFLVKAGDIDDLVKVAGINTLLWGGLFNPIIPIDKNKESAQRLLDSFHVDVLHAIVKTKEIDEFSSQYSFLQPPYFENKIFQKDYSGKNVIKYVDIKWAIDYYWEKEFKHKPKDYESNCISIKWDAQDNLSNLFSVMFGYFPHDYDLKHDYEILFLRGLKAKEIEIKQSDVLSGDISGKAYPILGTTIDLKGYGGRSFQNGLYLGESGNFTDLLNFWNLRASGLKLLFLPTNSIQKMTELAKTFSNAISELQNSELDTEKFISVYHTKDLTPHVETAVKEIIPSEGIGFYRFTETFWNAKNVTPHSYFSWEYALASVEKTTYGRYSVVVNLPEKRFLTDADYFAENQSLVVSISPIVEFEYPGHTLKPPPIKQLNEFCSREMTNIPWGLRIEKNGIGVITGINNKSISVYPIGYLPLITKIFEIAGIKAEISQPGLIADRIIERVDGIEGSRVFKISGVRKLLQELKTEDSISRGNATNMIWENGNFQKHEHLFIEARKHNKLNTEDVFNFLLKKDLFRAGLDLICTHCKLSNWLSLKELDDEWTCRYCGDKNRTSVHLQHRGDWKFRKSGLFAKDNNQEGAIPVILTLLVFLRIFEFSKFMYSTALNLHLSEKTNEIDFCIMQHERGDKVEIAIGECKSKEEK